MSLFKEKLKNITLKELLSLIIILFLIQYILNTLNVIKVEMFWVYVVVIIFFIYKFKGNFPSTDDFLEIFSENIFKNILFIVVLNILISYGFLYLSNYILDAGFIVFNSIIDFGLISTIVISPIAEELIFRGVFLNRLKLVVPSIFAVLISSLLFASLHSFGSIASAFIFGICMSVLYLKTDNIMVPIFAHFLNNFLAEIIVIFDSNKILFFNGDVVFVISVLAILSFILIFYFIVFELKNL